jgi:hypothetical protein
VRQHADLFDDYQNHADLTVAYAQRTFERDSGKVIGACNKLAAANISHRLALGGDKIVDHPLPADELRRAVRLFVVEPQDFLPADRETLASTKGGKRYETVEQALADITPAVQVETRGAVRVLPRVKAGGAVIHLVNWDYDALKDDVRPMQNVRLKLDLKALGIAEAKQAWCFAPGKEAKNLPIERGELIVPELDLWAVLELRDK